MTPTPQELGYIFEKEVAEVFGAKLQPGSGSRNYAQLDVKGTGFLISAKHTINKSFSLTRAIFQEARDALSGTNGINPTGVPIVVVRMQGQDGEPDLDVACIPLEDLAGWIKAPPGLVPATKTEALRESARSSTLLR